MMIRGLFNFNSSGIDDGLRAEDDDGNGCNGGDGDANLMAKMVVRLQV